MPYSRALLAGTIAALVIGAALWLLSAPDTPAGGSAFVELPAEGPITIALVGDTLVVEGPEAPGSGALVDLLRGASAGIANLELNLLADDTPENPARWPFGGGDTAARLRAIGIDAVSLANNHAADYGELGLRSTARLLDAHGILHAGTGNDLASARAAAFAGHGARGLALISVTSSSAEQSRATLTRGDIKGRPGVNPLRYQAEVTADPQTFSSLKSTVEMLQAGDATDYSLSLFGTTIHRGDRTSVDFRVDPDDVREVLDAVRAARSDAGVVVVALHSHEPTNATEVPADFVRDFARQAIDAGATLVVGHGPHRLRGIERYRGGLIFYSLGNFLYPAAAIDPRAADEFDAGTDLFARAVGMLAASSGSLAGLEDEAWWESVVAMVTTEDGRISGVELRPIDLGADLPLAERGMPRLATNARAAAILGTLARLSEPYGTVIRTADPGNWGAVELQ